MPREDPELAALVLERLRADGVELIEGASVTAVSGTAGAIRLTIGEGDTAREIEGTHLLLAVGRKANVEGLGLEEAGIAFDRRGITVGADLRSSNRRVYAIGDVAGGLQFTHVAGYHAGVVIRALLFRLPAKENREIIPRVTFPIRRSAMSASLRRRLARGSGRRGYGCWRRPLPATTGPRPKRARTGWCGWSRHAADGSSGRASSGRMRARSPTCCRWSSPASWACGILPVSSLPIPPFRKAVRRAAISYYADSARNPWIRRLVRFLARFG